MGRLVVIEGLDGAGKRTFAGALTAALADKGASVASFAFPRYESDVHAEIAREALYGCMGDLTSSVNAMALLFALDRRAAIPDLTAALESHDVVLVDRYIASNAAYSAARLGQRADGEVVEWVRALEIDRFGIPAPDHQLLLAPPRSIAAERAVARAVEEPNRPRDAYESDDLLQARTDAVYRELADREWLGRWTVLDGAAGARPGARSTAAVIGSDGDTADTRGSGGPDPAAPASLVSALLRG